jgi:hypothetical protein
MHISDCISTKNTLVKKTNKKLVLILILNITDGLLTYIGVSNNYAVEVNILMASVVTDFGRLLIYKLLLPSALILFVAFIINKYDYSKMTIARLFINLCFGLYICVLMLHIVWIGKLLNLFIIQFQF